MDIYWTCPICGGECQDEAASRCMDCHRSVHTAHVTEHRCSECRQRLGIDPPKRPAMYVDETRLLRLRLA